MATYPISPDGRPIPHALAYSRSRRVRNAFWFIREMSKRGSQPFEATRSKEVARTYQLEPALIRKIKARFRNELSFSPEGK